MHSTRRSVLLGGAGLAALGLAGCGLSGSADSGADPSEAASGEVTGEITFQTWSLKNERFTPYFEDIVEQFQSENPGTTVTWIDQPGEGYQDKVLSQANSDSLPDVVNLPPDMAYPLATGGFLLDIAGADPTLSEVYVPGGVEAYQFEGVEGSFGYPWYLGTDMNWWNLGALSEYGVDESSLPTSYDELFELARTVADAGGTNPVISNMPEITITSEGKEFTFNTPENVERVQQYADLYAEGALPAEVLNNDYAGNSTLFTQGKVLWTTSSSSFASDLATNAPTILEAAVPTPRFGEPPLFTQAVSLAAASKNLPTALAFAQFLTNDENQTAFVKIAQGFLPGTQKAAADPSSFAGTSDNAAQNAAVEVASASMEKAVDTTNVLWTEDMKTTLTQKLSDAMQGKITAQEALDSAVQYGNDNVL